MLYTKSVSKLGDLTVLFRAVILKLGKDQDCSFLLVAFKMQTTNNFCFCLFAYYRTYCWSIYVFKDNKYCSYGTPYKTVEIKVCLNFFAF